MLQSPNKRYIITNTYKNTKYTQVYFKFGASHLVVLTHEN